MRRALDSGKQGESEGLLLHGELKRSGPTFRSSMLLAYALGIVAGVTVAVVLQDASVLVPFLVLPLLGAPVLHALRGLPRKLLWLLTGTATAAGVVGVVYGRYVSDDGTVQALGVLGGSAAIAVSLAFGVALVVARPTTRIWNRRTSRGRRLYISGRGLITRDVRRSLLVHGPAWPSTKTACVRGHGG